MNISRLPCQNCGPESIYRFCKAAKTAICIHCQRPYDPSLQVRTALLNELGNWHSWVPPDPERYVRPATPRKRRGRLADPGLAQRPCATCRIRPRATRSYCKECECARQKISWRKRANKAKEG